jgi:hypothetical protein
MGTLQSAGVPAGHEAKEERVIKLSVDFEHPSRRWWESGGQELWEGLTAGFEETSVVIDDDVASSWLAEAARISGWDDGPPFAPHPIAVQALADDDPDA